MAVDSRASSPFLEGLSPLKELALVARGGTDSLPDLSGKMPTEMIEYLREPAGKKDLAIWHEVFADTLASLEQMEVMIHQHADDISRDDLKQGEKAIQKCYEGLKVWLMSAPAVRSGSRQPC